MAGTANGNGFSWWMSPAQVADAFLALGRPPGLSQPILPGWSFGNVISVTEQNSSAPDTERRVISAVSYGKQLGRIMDALCAVIDELPGGTQGNAAFGALKEVKDEIDAVKLKAAEQRLTQIKSDLALLKSIDSEKYWRLRDDLQAALGRPTTLGDERPAEPRKANKTKKRPA